MLLYYWFSGQRVFRRPLRDAGLKLKAPAPRLDMVDLATALYRSRDGLVVVGPELAGPDAGLYARAAARRLVVVKLQSTGFDVRLDFHPCDLLRLNGSSSVHPDAHLHRRKKMARLIT
jgi:hypothetical protein